MAGRTSNRYRRVSRSFHGLQLIYIVSRLVIHRSTRLDPLKSSLEASASCLGIVKVLARERRACLLGGEDACLACFGAIGAGLPGVGRYASRLATLALKARSVGRGRGA